jgi:glyoxylase-like metal-dependent hydrolase (beta-lactamase superfamily II)
VKESLLFPSAEFVASETEVKFWNAPELTAKVSPALKPEVTRANLKLASPRLRLIKAGTEVAPGVSTIDTAGHTPGHMSVHISSGSEELLLTADAVVNSTVSFQHPEWPFRFDQDVPLATKTRMAFLDRAEPTRRWSAVTISPSPALGTWCARGAATAGCRQIGSGRADGHVGRGWCALPLALLKSGP